MLVRGVRMRVNNYTDTLAPNDLVGVTRIWGDNDRQTGGPIFSDLFGEPPCSLIPFAKKCTPACCFANASGIWEYGKPSIDRSFHPIRRRAT